MKFKEGTSRNSTDWGTDYTFTIEASREELTDPTAKAKVKETVEQVQRLWEQLRKENA